MAYQITHAKEIQRKSRGHHVRQIGPHRFKVRSEESGRTYYVSLGPTGGTCTCPWGRYRSARDHRSGCSHVIAAINYRAKRRGRRISVWGSERAARRQHRPMFSIGDGLIITSRMN
jgi:hypothetical protein